MSCYRAHTLRSLAHLTQLLRIHKEFQSPTRDTRETSNYTTEEWLKGVVMDWMVTLWNTLLQTVSRMPSVTLQPRENTAAATGSWLYSRRTPTSLCAFTHKVQEFKGEGRGRGRERETRGAHTAQKCLQSRYWTPLLRLLFISCQPSWHAHLALGT